jgi:cytoskeletal protein RodZ
MPHNRFLKQYLSLCLVASLVLPFEAYASTGHNDAQQSSLTSQTSTQNTEPATTGQDSGAPAPQSTGASQNSSQTSSQNGAQTPTQQPSKPQEQQPPPKGTAAAPDTRVDGVPAATPSGAAIAPAKQKRVRRFSIRTALVVGAVIAVGTVAGLSLATSAKPSN